MECSLSRFVLTKAKCQEFSFFMFLHYILLFNLCEALIYYAITMNSMLNYKAMLVTIWLQVETAITAISLSLVF